MRLRSLALLLPALLLAACFDKSDEDEDDGDGSSDGDDTATTDWDTTDDPTWDSTGDSGWSDDSWDPDDTTDSGDTTVECAWEDDGLDLMISGGDSSGYFLGLAEIEADGWTGEDCYLGYTTGSGVVFSYCHPTERGGVFLATVSSPADIVEGATTLHRADLKNAYMLEERATGLCWAWGMAPEYYAGLGCTMIALACRGD